MSNHILLTLGNHQSTFCFYIDRPSLGIPYERNHTAYGFVTGFFY